VKKLWIVSIVSILPALPVRAGVKDDLLQQAFNYVLTGTTEPKESPEITDRNSCVVVVRDLRFPRFIRYYFGRFKPDTSRISKKYAGTRTLYQLDVESEDVIIEYLV
jgi:hypothetical protein